MSALPPSFYERWTPDVARDLIGCVLVSWVDGCRTAGRIVETEAYGEDDPASHAWKGPTARNSAMFGPPGTAYVYRSYGVHWCFNVVTQSCGMGEAVLIRALEPVDGIPVMQARRAHRKLEELCAGPGRLCAALGITADLNGVGLAGPLLSVMAPINPPGCVVSSPRIGITRACERPWRFCEAGSRFLSRRLRTNLNVPMERA